MKRFIATLLTMCLVVGCITFLPSTSADAAAKYAYTITVLSKAVDGEQVVKVDKDGKVKGGTINVYAGESFSIELYDNTNKSKVPYNTTTITSTGKNKIDFFYYTYYDFRRDVGIMDKAGAGELTVKYGKTKAVIKIKATKNKDFDGKQERNNLFGEDYGEEESIKLDGSPSAYASLQLSNVKVTYEIEDGAVVRTFSAKVKNKADKTVTLKFNSSDENYKIKSGKSKNIKISTKEYRLSEIRDPEEFDYYYYYELDYDKVNAFVDDLQENGPSEDIENVFGSRPVYSFTFTYGKVTSNANISFDETKYVIKN